MVAAWWTPKQPYPRANGSERADMKEIPEDHFSYLIDKHGLTFRDVGAPGGQNLPRLDSVSDFIIALRK